MKKSLAVLVLFPLITLTVASNDDPSSAPPAMRFIDAIWQRLEILEETACHEMPEKLQDAYRCGRVDGWAANRAAHLEAFELAGRGVPVLELGMPTVPPNQLADLPGFEPFEWVEGFHVRGYLIGQHRVGVWTSGSQVVITLEELDGPFPEIMPATTTD